MKGNVFIRASLCAAALVALVCVSYYLGKRSHSGGPSGDEALRGQQATSLAAVEERLQRLEQELASLRDESSADAPGAPGEASPGEEDRLAAMESTLAAMQLRVRGLEEDPVRRGFSFVASENAEMRREGINILDRIARFDPEARAVLRELLNDPSERVREQAAQKLRDLKDKESAPAMVALLSDSYAGARRRAVQALGAAEATEYTSEIGGCLVSDSESWVREEAARVLGRLGSPEGAQFLTEALKDPNESVRGAAIASLGEIGSTSAVPQLRALYDKDPGRYRIRLIQVLQKLGDAAPLQQEVSRLSQVVASDTDERVREQAIRDLSTLARDASQPIFNQAMEDPSPRVRRAAERALR